MAIIQSLIAVLTNSAGKILNTVFGWATLMLFGKLSQKKQILMSIVAFLSMLWICALIGIVFPAAGLFLIAAFVPKELAHHDMWIRVGMGIAVFVIPFAVGGVRLFDKPQALFKDKLRQIVQGWPFTVGLSITMILLLISAPIMKHRCI